MIGILQWILHWTGGDNGSGPIYLEWSGFVGDTVIFAALISWYRNNKCKRCYRIAHIKVAGTHYKTCHKHATNRDHNELYAHHEAKHPDQHRFLNGDIINAEEEQAS